MEFGIRMDLINAERRLKEVTAERDELLTALKDCHELACYGDCGMAAAPVRHTKTCAARAALINRFDLKGATNDHND